MTLPCISKVVSNKNKSSKRFRLINCLAVFGVLAGNTSPVISQTTYDPTTEAKQNVGALMRAEQAYWLENGYFTESIPELGTGVPAYPAKTTYYRYSIVKGTDTSHPQNDPTATGVSIRAQVLNTPIARGPGSIARGVVAGVATYTIDGYVTTISKVCVATLPASQGGNSGVGLMFFTKTGLECPQGTK